MSSLPPPSTSLTKAPASPSVKLGKTACSKRPPPDELAAREEYARFRGVRCEIQIQTLLSHAWAESSHDIIYKGADTPGFGSKAVDMLRARLNKTMDEYLKPAGYELDKVQADYDRLMQGKDLFNRGELEALTRCDNNNDRFDRLKAIRRKLDPEF